MVRIIIEVNEMCPDGSCVGQMHKTFDVDLPEVERYLKSKSGYEAYKICGIEVLEAFKK